MQSRTTIVLLSSLLVLSLGGVGWQAWSGHEMKQQLEQLQQRVAALPANPAPVQPGAPLAGGQPQVPAPVDPFQNATPLDPGNLAQNPFAEFERMQQQMHEQMRALMGGQGGSFFDLDAFGPNGFSFMGGSLGGQPEIAVDEKADAYEVTIAIPEGSNVEVNTAVDGRELTIEGKVTVENQAQGTGFTSMRTQQFARSMMLPDDVDAAGIRNETRDNQVIITIPKVG